MAKKTRKATKKTKTTKRSTKTTRKTNRKLQKATKKATSKKTARKGKTSKARATRKDATLGRKQAAGVQNDELKQAAGANGTGSEAEKLTTVAPASGGADSS